MTDTSSAELSIVASRTLGLRFSLPALEQILGALLEAYSGKSSLRTDGSDLLQSLKLEVETRREVDLRRIRMQAAKAARETAHYAEIFLRIGLDPSRLTWDDIPRIPLTPKEAIRDHPYDFVARSVKPAYCFSTTGTTGRPTTVCFSEYEIEVAALLGAIGDLMIGDLTPEDIFMLSGSSRAMLANTTNTRALTLGGATVIHGGQVDPALTLSMLAEQRRIPGKKPRVSLVQMLPSYLGEVVETGLRIGYQPSDFGLRRIDTGGEIVTEGVKKRAKNLFGPVPFYEGYGNTETWPMGSQICPDGHLHFGGSSAHVELVNPDTWAPAESGEVAAIVATPLPPYRETTLLLRYNTQDMVRLPDAPPTCSLSQLPGTSPLLGKQNLSVRHDTGWTFPREVLEALEAVEAVPLPARCGFWAVPGGVAVEVVARSDSAEARKAIGDSLEAHGVPVRELRLWEERGQLQRPYPLRGDLKETSFALQ